MKATPAPVVSHQNVRLGRGAHRSGEDGACIMELVSMLAGESFSDRPRTACPVIGAFLRAYNDVARDAPRQDLLACAAAVVGTRRPEAEPERVRRCADLAIACYHDQPWWWLQLDGGHGLLVALDVADTEDDPNLDRLGYQVAKLVRRSRHGRARVVAFVEELAAVGAPARPTPRRDPEAPLPVHG
jgi:hypothetical protein